MWFKCSVCAEKDKRISDMRSEIEHLRKLLRPDVDQAALTMNSLEADGILSGQQHIIEIPDQIKLKVKEQEDELSEASRILAGTY